MSTNARGRNASAAAAAVAAMGEGGGTPRRGRGGKGGGAGVGAQGDLVLSPGRGGNGAGAGDQGSHHHLGGHPLAYMGTAGLPHSLGGTGGLPGGINMQNMHMYAMNMGMSGMVPLGLPGSYVHGINTMNGIVNGLGSNPMGSGIGSGPERAGAGAGGVDASGSLFDALIFAATTSQNEPGGNGNNGGTPTPGVSRPTSRLEEGLGPAMVGGRGDQSHHAGRPTTYDARVAGHENATTSPMEGVVINGGLLGKEGPPGATLRESPVDGALGKRMRKEGEDEGGAEEKKRVKEDGDHMVPLPHPTHHYHHQGDTTAPPLSPRVRVPSSSSPPSASPSRSPGREGEGETWEKDKSTTPPVEGGGGEGGKPRPSVRGALQLVVDHPGVQHHSHLPYPPDPTYGHPTPSPHRGNTEVHPNSSGTPGREDATMATRGRVREEVELLNLREETKQLRETIGVYERRMLEERGKAEEYLRLTMALERKVQIATARELDAIQEVVRLRELLGEVTEQHLVLQHRVRSTLHLWGNAHQGAGAEAAAAAAVAGDVEAREGVGGGDGNENEGEPPRVTPTTIKHGGEISPLSVGAANASVDHTTTAPSLLPPFDPATKTTTATATANANVNATVGHLAGLGLGLGLLGTNLDAAAVAAVAAATEPLPPGVRASLPGGGPGTPGKVAVGDGGGMVGVIHHARPQSPLHSMPTVANQVGGRDGEGSGDGAKGPGRESGDGDGGSDKSEGVRPVGAQ